MSKVSVSSSAVIHRFNFNTGDRVEFIPIENMAGKVVPEFSHRVIINGIGADWLSRETRPSKKAALFFFEKHGSGKLSDALLGPFHKE